MGSARRQTPLRGQWQRCVTPLARLLAAGDRVGSLEVNAAPGHTPGHIVFLDTRDSTLIVGDAFQTLGGVAVAGTVRPFFPIPGLTTWHKPTAVGSGYALLALMPTRLAVGRGAVLRDPVSAMRQAIAAAEKHGGTDAQAPHPGEAMR